MIRPQYVGTALLLIASGMWIAPAHAVSTIRLELSNDVILSSDNQFTNGTSLILSSGLAGNLSSTRGTPALGKALVAWMIPDQPGLAYRETWVLGQNIQTPAEIEEPGLIANDVPYVGFVGIGNSFYGFDDERFFGAQWLIGWVGEEALSEETQSAIHAVIGGDDPRGWDNQLSTEPILNLYLSAKRRVYERSWFDVAVAGDIAVGNFFTFVQPGLEFRFGDRPGGFHFVPDPVGRGMDYDASLNDSARRSYFYGSLTLRATHFAWALPREGNLFADNEWTDTSTIDMERTVGQSIIGVHWIRQNLGVHLSLWLSTDTVDKSNLPSSEDPRNSFGSLMMEYRF